jgi:conserved repeat domain
MRLLFFFLLIFLFSFSAQAWTPLDSVHINSGNPKFPFPQFLPYQNPSGTLYNLATHSGVGVTHAEMEQTIRDAYRIAMNRASKPGGGVGGTDYVYFNSDCNCTEGDGYGLLSAVAMADKKTFDGMWLYIHDKFMNNVKRYSDCQMNSPNYIYSKLPAVYHIIGQNSAADGDVDIGLALLCAYYQWGEFMGINDACGNPISYKKEALAYLKTFTDTVPFSLSTDNKYLSGDIGFDGYFKGGDSWGELTDWAQTNGPFKPYQGKQTPQYIDYTAPSYYKEFAQFLQSQDPQNYSWNISQFSRAEASSDWLMGQILQQSPRYIPFAGNVVLSDNNVPTITKYNQGEDFRLAWRTILNYVWHGNPSSTWDPVAHQPKTGLSNTYEHDIGQRYAKFLWDTRQSPWNDTCVTVSNVPYKFWGPSVLWTNWDINGTTGNNFWLNWIQGTGSPSAIISQDFNLMAEMYRQCETIWDADLIGDGYLTSTPHYFHEWFRLLGLLVLSGNYQAPSNFQATSNMKVYMAIDKTFGFQNDSVTYTIDYRNYGSKDASGVTIVDTLPKDFIFLSAPGGVLNTATNVVTWNIGAVPGFQTTTGIKPTTGEVVLKIKVGNPTQTQYRNRATITCSNGSGWTSNEYPNDISSVMKRNFLDIAKRALVVKNLVSTPSPKSGTTVQFTINYKNTSDAGWINGGRPGVHFSFSQTVNSQSTMNTMRFKLFHDANEAYIDFGNYRVSYFLFDSINTCVQGVNACATGWQKTQTITKGINDPTTVKLLQEIITPGRDSLGRWNQRIVIQFSDPTNPNRIINLSAPDALLEQYYGNSGSNIHRGGSEPLWLVWYINSSSWTSVNWTNGWSWDAKANDIDQGMFFPVTNDWTDLDNPNIPVTTWNQKSCQTATHTVNNVLVEEWDGYTWRRVAGNGPLPGRDVDSVVIRDTVPAGLTLNSASVPTPPGFTKTVSGNVITWTKPVMQVNDSGAITFSATASSSCPLPTKRLVNRAWISGFNESPVSDSAILTLACSTAIFSKSYLWLTDTTNKIIPSGDTAHIDSTIFNIMIVDTDRNINNNVRDTITALVYNPSSGDSLIVNLIETGNASDTFRSASRIKVASQHGPNQISTSGGETVYILYTGLFDTSSAKLVTLSTFPVPVYGWLLDANGDGRADSAVVIYSKALTARPDSLLFYFPDQATFQTVKPGQGAIQQNGNIVTVSFAVPFATATTSFISGGTGSGFSYLTDGVTARKFQFPVADSIGPVITSAQVVERAGGSTIDTLYATFSEAITPASLKGVSLVLVKNGVSTVITIDAVRTLISTRFALACAAGTPQPLAGDSLRINPAGPARDLYGNGAHPRNPAVVILLRQIPPTIVKAYYVDRNAGRADGYVDTAFIQFNKKVSLGDLSFLLDWSNGLLVDNIRGDTISYIGTDSTRVGIALRTVFPYTGILRTSGAMNIIARFDDFPGESRQGTVVDSAAPVIDSATYYVNTNTARACDTLVVVFSEPVTINQSLNPFRLSGKSASSYTFALTPIAFAGKIDTFCVSSASLPGVPQNGDTMWIAANNSVSDAGGVFQNNGNNRKVLVNVVQHKIDWKPFLACNPFTPGPGFICSAANGQPGTVITIKPINPLLALPHMTLRLQIFDVLGNFIFESPLAQKGADGNSYYFVWDGRNKNSRWVGSGVYRAVITVIDENGTSSKSITIGVKR